MRRPRKCKVCTGDLAITGQVNALIESGVRLKTIAEQVPTFSTYQLSRHKRNCLAPKGAPEPPSDGGSAEIAKWMERADDLYLTAGANGDVRSQVAALSAAVRSIGAREKQKQKEREIEPPNPNTLTIEKLDQLVRDYVTQMENERGVCRSGAAVCPK